VKTPVKTLFQYEVDATDSFEAPQPKRIKLHLNSDDTYSVHVLEGREVVDEEWFNDLYDAKEYADELRQSMADRRMKGRAAIDDVRLQTPMNLIAGKACADAIARVIRQGRAVEALNLLKSAGLA
jgi:hypothetical protein